MSLVSSPVPILSSTDTEFYDEDSDSDFDEAGFDHPSTYLDQPWIWVPKDELGMSEQIVAELRKGGIDASDEGAYIDPYGSVEVTRNPPDEAWVGGQDAWLGDFNVSEPVEMLMDKIFISSGLDD